MTLSTSRRLCVSIVAAVVASAGYASSAAALPAGASPAATADKDAAELANAVAAGAHAFSFTSIDGAPFSLSDFRGKTLLIVNTASFCGFTRQYADLQDLWSRYRDHGLVVLGVPSNDFGDQEPGSEAEIKQFCEVNFAVDFPLTAKEHVVGPAAHPFYVWAGDTLGPGSAPRWNFHKYLVAPDGRLVRSFSTMTSPTAEVVISAIEPLLAPSGELRR